MRPYILEFKKSDFVNGRTEVIDLYVNDQYTNYSIRRSQYGSDLLGTGVYTGTDAINATQSEIGYVDGDRFVDTTSRVDITTWQIDIVPTGTATGAPIPTLSVYHAPDDPRIIGDGFATPAIGDDNPADWAYQLGIREVDDIYIINANRYVFFEIDFDGPITNFDYTVQILIEIDPPAVNAFFTKTGDLLNKFPQWMEINEFDPQDPSYSQKATPDSVGGKFLNAIAGEWLTDIAAKIDYQQAQYYLDSVDISQKAWVYRATAVPNVIKSIEGDGIELARAADIPEFYAAESGDYPTYWNRNTNEVFVLEEFDDFKINGVSFNLKPYHVWNALDDIGATVDLWRNRLESNENFKLRLQDVYKNKPGASAEAFKTALRRELDLWKVEGATPDSDYAGATPSLLEMSELINDREFFTERGLPTRKFKALIEELARKYPITWGYFEFDKAYWDPDGTRRDGIAYLPRLFDATPVAERYADSGVGDINDIYLFRPDLRSSTIEFETNLRIRGRRKTTRQEYGPLLFDIAVYGQADRDIWTNPAFTGAFTIELTLDEATPRTLFANVNVTTTSDVDYDTATPTASSRAYIEWATVSGTTNASYNFYDKATGQIYYSDDATPTRRIDLDDIATVTIKPGAWNPVSQTYTSVPTQSQYKLWFSHAPSTVLGSGGSSSDISLSSFNFFNTTGAFYVESQRTQHTVVTDGYSTDKHLYTIRINDANPPTSPKDYILDLPNFYFPSDTTNREIVVELLTSWDNTTFGAASDADAATPIFLPSTYIAVNGNNTWVSTKKKTLASSTTQLTFSSTSGADYPYIVPHWVPYEKDMTAAIEGIVDQNGPWRDGEPLPESNTNYALVYLTGLSRDDFGIPDTTDYILTWIGIASTSSTDVLTWVDSNTIKPAVTYAGETDFSLEYPTNAVQETLVGGNYVFSPIVIYAKLKPGTNEKWLPKVHSGYFYDSQEEYYLYANPKTVTTTGTSLLLPDVNRQGAPVIAYGVDNGTPYYNLRQVASYYMDDYATPATPTLTFQHWETFDGNGLDKYFTAYADISGIVVHNDTLDVSVAVQATSTTGNEVRFTAPTDERYTYTISYWVGRSYYVNNDYLTTNGYLSQVVFEDTPGSLGYDNYTVVYESSIYDPATPIDVPLNTMFTSFNEGFIYIDHDVYDLERIELAFSPSKVIANGNDFGLVTVRAYDPYGNPKPNETINLYTNFGTLSSSAVETDDNGFAHVNLNTELWDGTWNPSPATPALSAPSTSNGYRGQILAVGGGVQGLVTFSIDIPAERTNLLFASAVSDAVLADNQSAASIQGKIEDADHNPIPFAKIYWRKGRNIFDTLSKVPWAESAATPGDTGRSGYVYADVNGRFVIEPFITDDRPGYWFVSVESKGFNAPATPTTFTLVGDIVSWYEYPNVNAAVDPITNLPISNNQDATPVWQIPNYTLGSVFPVTYDEEDYEDDANAATPQWVPPRWYAINRYRQYQMGLRGNDYYVVGATPSHPDYKEF